MKARQVWEMTVEELERKEGELYDQLFKLRFQLSTGQIDNPLRLRTVRKDLARVKTILGAKLKGETGPVVTAVQAAATEAGRAAESAESEEPGGGEAPSEDV